MPTTPFGDEIQGFHICFFWVPCSQWGSTNNFPKSEIDQSMRVIRAIVGCADLHS